MIVSASKQRKIGILISYFSLFTSILLYILYTPFLLSKIGDDQYGLKAFVDSITSWMSILSTAMASSYIRFATLEKNQEGDEGLKKTNGVFAFLFLLSAVIAFLAMLAIFLLFRFNVIPLNNYTDSQKQLILCLFLISSALVLLNIISTLFTLFQEYQQKYIWLRTIALFQTVLHAVVAIPFLMNGCDVVVVVLCSLGVNLLIFLFNVVFSVRHLRMSFSFKRNSDFYALAKSVVIFSFYILLNAIVDEVNNNADKMILGFLSTPENVTIYQLGMTFSIYLSTASVAISSSFVPKINELVASGNKEELNKTFLKVSKVQMLVIFTLIGGFATCGKEFVTAWVGSDKIMAYYVGLILLFLDSVPLSENTGIEIQRAMNKHKFRAYAYIVISIVNILVSLLFVSYLPKDQTIFGCLYGTIFAGIAGTWIAMNIYNSRVIGLDIKHYLIVYGKNLLIVCISAGTSLLIFYYIKLDGIDNYWVKTIIEGATFLLIHISILFFFNYKDIRSLCKSRLSKR